MVVLDLQLSLSGPAYDDLRRLVDDDRQVIVHTMRDSQEVALTCLELGAFTFLTKAEGERHLVAATRAAAVHAARAGRAIGSDARPHRQTLAPREIDVLIEWFQCESKGMVAERLGLSVRTVNSYLDRVRIRSASRSVTTRAAVVTGRPPTTLHASAGRCARIQMWTSRHAATADTLASGTRAHPPADPPAPAPPRPSGG